jgi:hypothetical protein
MADKCSRSHSQHIYHASAFGLAGELIRPHRHTIPTQAATVLGTNGGRGFQRVENFSTDGMISFAAAQVEVGGSFDECHGYHTTFAHSVIEDLNIADIVKADKVVARLAIYSATEDNPNGENSFDITGSHFENLRVAGHKLDVKLATHRFHDCHTYKDLEDEYVKKSADELLCFSKLSQDSRLKQLEKEYHAVEGLAQKAEEWKSTSKKRSRGVQSYWCSAANDLEKHIDKDSELQAIGSFIFIPKFGVIRLAQVVVYKDTRSLTMLTVQMCSSGEGSINGGGTTGNGTGPPGGG